MPQFNISAHLCIRCGRTNGSDCIPKPEPNALRDKLPRRVIRDKKKFDNTYHPGVEDADLYHEVHRVRVSDREPYPELSLPETWERKSDPKLLCHNCGWTIENETSCTGYTSRLKIAYIRDNSACWDLGPNGPWMLRDENNNPTDVWKTDYTVQQFIKKEKPSIPLVEMHRYGGPEDKFHFTIMARAKGKLLSEIGNTLTREQMSDVVQDLREHIKQWRQITSPQMQRVDGSALKDAAIGNCTGHGCIKTGHNEEEWLENLTPAMRKGMLWKIWAYRRNWKADLTTMNSWVVEVDKKIDQFKANFPRGGPYVLTHGDLHPWNIFVSDDNPEKKFKVSAIIDWEMAGFFPWWVEAYRGQLPRLANEILGDDTDFFHPGYSESKDYKDDILKRVKPVKDAWFSGGYHALSKHGADNANRWYREPFCACRPYAQEYQELYQGAEQEHKDLFDIDSSDSEDECDSEDEIVVHKFTKRERKFLRWFMSISKYD